MATKLTKQQRAVVLEMAHKGGRIVYRREWNRAHGIGVGSGSIYFLSTLPHMTVNAITVRALQAASVIEADPEFATAAGLKNFMEQTGSAWKLRPEYYVPEVL